MDAFSLEDPGVQAGRSPPVRRASASGRIGPEWAAAFDWDRAVSLRIRVSRTKRADDNWGMLMKIVISHVYSSRNNGDAAILSAQIHELKDVFRNPELCIFTVEKIEDGYTFDGVPACNALMYRAVSPGIGKAKKLLIAIAMVTYTAIWVSIFRLCGIALPLPRNWKEPIQLLVGADMQVCVGGGYLRAKNDWPSTVTLLLHFHQIWLAKALGKPVYLYSQSFGPYPKRVQRKIAVVGLKHADLVLVREGKSKALLANMGFVGEQVIQVPDSAFAAAPASKFCSPQRFFSRRPGEHVVGITVRSWLPEAEQQSYELAMAEFIDSISRQNGFKVVVIAQVTSIENNDDDRVAGRRIQKLLTNSGDVEFLSEQFTLYEIASIYSDLNYLVGTRFHSVIFALTAGVPSLAIEYEHKTSGIMKDLGLERWVLPMEDVTSDRLMALFELLVRDREAYVRKLRDVLPSYVERAREASRIIEAKYRCSQYASAPVPVQQPSALEMCQQQSQPSPGRRVTDHLVRNSLYLMLSAGIQAALGFTFWIIMARLFSTGDVGRASSLISATAVIAYLSLFGLNSTLVRFLPTAPDKGSLITAAFILVAGAGTTIGLAYILLTPVLAPRLAFVEHRPALAVGFALFAAASAVNLLTDSVFIAFRKAGFCALTDGVVGGLSKIVFGVTLAGTGAYGLFCASAGGLAAAALVSVVLIITVLHLRPSLKESFLAVKPLLKFSGANYIANALNLLPVVVLPLIVLDRLGAQAAAYYFVAFQMATLLYAAVFAIESAFLAEGSQAGADWRAIRRRSRRLGIMIFVPAGGVLVLAAHWVLLAFGSRYSQHGTTSLELLAVAVIPIAACNWSWTVLRLAGRLTALVVCNAVYSGAICGLAWILASHGLVALTAAWPVGATLTAAIATVLSATVSNKAPTGHRKTARSKPSRLRTARVRKRRGIIR